MASVPSGGTFKPNKATYRQILKSQMASDICMKAARSVGGVGINISPRFDGNRQKARVFSSKEDVLSIMRPRI